MPAYLPVTNCPERGIIVEAFDLFRALAPPLPYEQWLDQLFEQHDMDEYIDCWQSEIDIPSGYCGDVAYTFAIHAAMQVARAEATPHGKMALEHLREQRYELYMYLGGHKRAACREALSRPGLN